MPSTPNEWLEGRKSGFGEARLFAVDEIRAMERRLLTDTSLDVFNEINKLLITVSKSNPAV